MSNMVEILITAKDLAAPALGQARAQAARFQAEAQRQSVAASASANRRRALETERERLFAAEQASIARRAAGETTAAQRAAEREQIALARRANQQQIAAARTAEREQVAAARRASAQVAAAQRAQVDSARANAGRMKSAMAAAAVATVAIGVESIKMASKFDASMTLLHTQAGVAQDKMAGLKSGVLALAGKVGQDPDSLAESLFHVESNFESMGISSAKALKLTETAAKGATVGHADLVDVTNALTAAVAAGVPGVKNLDQAMGVLNATVGVGDMKMQDLADAFGTGMLATVKGFGLSIQDVGAGLAVFGDNNIRGALAGNQLRMSVQALAKPVSTAGDTLKMLGLKTDTLAKDMQKGGLKLALEDLIDRMHKAGVSSKEQGKVITDAFGRKAGAGLNILVDQFDRMESKYPKLNEGAHKFGSAWEDTKKTFQFQMKAMRGELDSLMIQLGVKLIPVASKFLGFLSDVAKNGAVKDVLKSMGDEGGAALDALAGGAKVAAPFLKEIASGFQAMLEFGTPFISEMGRVGSAIADALMPASSAKGLDGPFSRLLTMVRENKGAIQEAARGFGNALVTMSEAAISNLPIVVKMFRTLTDIALVSLGGLIDGAAKAFGWVPGIGGKLKAAAKGFDGFRDSVMQGMAKADQATSSFAQRALPRLEQARLKLNISDWQAQIKTAKSQLEKGVPAARAAYLKAHIEDLKQKVAEAKKSLGSIDHRAAVAKVEANSAPFFGTLAKVKGARIPTKTAAIRANAGGFWGAVRGIAGRVLGTSYINVQMRKVESQNAPAFRARGGPIHLAGGGAPDGGRIVGPGSGTSDSIPAMLSNGEYVVRASSVQKYGESFLNAVNSGTLKIARFAKGGLSKSEKQARHDAMGELTISHFGHMAGYQRSEFGSALGKPDSVSSLVNALNQWRSIIMKATHGGQEKSLLKALDSSGKKLLGWEKQLTKVSASLEKAKDKLNSLKDASSQLASSVKGNLISSASVVHGTGDGGPVTLASVKQGMTVSRDKVTAFASALKQLKSKGFSKTIIQQVAEAGIDGGGLETAGALLQASTSEVQTINATQGQIEKAAGAAGKTTADAVYAKAIKDQTAAVKKLTDQQDKLRRSMDKLAKSMEKMIEKAFGKKAAGGIVGMAAAGGIRGGLTWVGEHEPELLDLPVGSRVWSGPDSRRKLAAAQAPWASMLNSPRRRPAAASAYAAAASAGGDGQPIVIQVRIGDRDFGELWVDAGRKQVRARGGIEATLRPPRGR
jgi:TP901 family phage tail tape measure protein